MPETSDTNVTRVTRLQHEWDTRDTSATQVRHECNTNDTNIILITTQVEDYKERYNFIVSTTFGNTSFPYQNAFEKRTTKTELCNSKSYIKKLYTRLQLQFPLHAPA